MRCSAIRASSRRSLFDNKAAIGLMEFLSPISESIQSTSRRTGTGWSSPKSSTSLLITAFFLLPAPGRPTWRTIFHNPRLAALATSRSSLVITLAKGLTAGAPTWPALCQASVRTLASSSLMPAISFFTPLLRAATATDGTTAAAAIARGTFFELLIDMFETLSIISVTTDDFL